MSKQKHLLSPLIITLAIIVLLSQNSCVLINKIAGADIDSLQFAKARQAKIMEIRLDAARDLTKKMANDKDIFNSDISFYINESLLNKIAGQYIGTKGWLDEGTSFIVKDVSMKLHYGSAIATIGLLAHSHDYDVDVDLAMDCLFAFEIKDNELVGRLEPFNIIPVVDAAGVLSISEGLIENLLKINLGKMGDNFDGLKIPMELNNDVKLDEKNIAVRDKVNLDVKIPAKTVKYKLELLHFLILEGKAFISLKIDDIDVY